MVMMVLEELPPMAVLGLGQRVQRRARLKNFFGNQKIIENLFSLRIRNHKHFARARRLREGRGGRRGAQQGVVGAPEARAAQKLAVRWRALKKNI